MELAQALEVPLLGAHPAAPDTGLVKYYTLTSDLREYARFDDGNVQYRQPRYWHWKMHYQGSQDNTQWLRNTDASPQSRRTNFLVPFDTARLANFTFTSRNTLSPTSAIRIRIFEEPIDSAGDIANNDTITVTVNSTDVDVSSQGNGRRFMVDLRSRNIVVDNTKRYAADITNTGDFEDYRETRIDIGIEERAVQP